MLAFHFFLCIEVIHYIKVGWWYNNKTHKSWDMWNYNTRSPCDIDHTFWCVKTNPGAIWPWYILTIPLNLHIITIINHYSFNSTLAIFIPNAMFKTNAAYNSCRSAFSQREMPTSTLIWRCSVKIIVMSISVYLHVSRDVILRSESESKTKNRTLYQEANVRCVGQMTETVLWTGLKTVYI